MAKLATYKKRGGTTNRGKEFESLLGAFYAVKLTFSPSVIDFQISINNDFFGDFDDVILRIKYADGSVKTFAFQLKHVEKAKTLQSSALLAKSGEFSLHNCLEIYKKIAKLPNCYFIACTNRCANFKDGAQFSEFRVERSKCAGGGMFDTNTGKNWGTYTFSSTSEEYSTFFKNFYLYCNQQNDINLKESFASFLKSKVQTDIFSAFYEYMRVWSAGSFILTKLDVVMKLTELLFSPMIRSLDASIINDNTKLLEEAIMQFDFTLVENGGEEITKIWSKTSSFCDTNTISKASVKYGLTIKGVKKIEDLDIDQRSKVFWFLGVTPLVVNIDNSKEEQIRVVLDILAGCTMRRKVILIGDFSYDSPKAFIFKNLGSISVLDDLRHKISRNYKCTLQEKAELSIGDLCIADEFTVGALVQIALHSRLNIGNSLENLPPSYIPRDFYKILVHFNIIDSLPKSKILLSCNGHFETAKRFFQRRIIKITCKELTNLDNYIFATEKEFSKKEAEEQYPPYNGGSYHLRVVPNQYCLELLRTRGRFEEVIPFRLNNNEHVFGESQFREHYHNRVCVLVSYTGTGKTSFLKRIKNIASSDVWVILFNLKDSIFSKCFEQETQNALTLVKHLAKQTNSYSKFENKLWENFQSNKIMILWDGFDELPENCWENFCDVVNNLDWNKTTQWITAKPSSKLFLENYFKVFALSMVPLSKEQQISYIKNRSNVTDSMILEKFFLSLSIVEENHYLGVPLHLYILTENFNKNPEYLNAIFTLTDMCQVFIEDKYKHYLNENGMGNLQAIKSLISGGKTYRMNQYKLAAVSTYFPKFALKYNLTVSSDFAEDIVQNGDFLSLISKFNKDGTVVFENSFFGDYLCALGLVEHHSPDLVNELFEKRNASIKFMFDLIAAKQEPIFLAVLYRHFDRLKEHDIVKDTFGRTPLQILCTYGSKHPLCWRDSNRLLVHSGDKVEADDQNLLDAVLYLSTKCNPLEKDNLFGLTSFEYAAHALCLGLINIMSGDLSTILPNLPHYNEPANVLYYALKFNYSNIFNVISKIPSLSYYDDGNLLHLAVKFGREDFLKWVLQDKMYQKTVNVSNPKRKVSMQLASAGGSLSVMKYLKERGGTLPLRAPSILSLAVDQGFKDIVQFLLEHNYSPNDLYEEDFYNQSLILAIKHGYIDICELLLQYGVRFCKVGKDGLNALHVALQYEQFSVAEFFIAQGVSIDILDKNYQSGFHHAAMANRKKAILFLFEKNAQCFLMDKFGNNSLHYAAQYGSLEVVELLIAAGLSISDKNELGFTPFHLAIHYGHLHVAKVLGNSEINVPNNYGRTPMHSAALAGLHDCLEFLIENGGCLECMDQLYQRRPIHYAAWNGYDECVDFFLRNGAELDSPGKFGCTPLYLAAEAGNFECCQSLLEAGACITTENRSFKTPLSISHDKKRRNIILLMYEHVPKSFMEDPHISDILNCLEDINAVVPNSVSGSRPIHLACLDNNLEGVIYLLKRNVEFTVIDNDGNTPLHCALKNFPSVVISELLLNLDKENYLINAKTKQGLTALHLASQAGCFELDANNLAIYHEDSLKLIDVFLEAGATINFEDNDGFIPLHYAAYSGCLEIVEKLVNVGSAVNHCNKYGRTALHLASTKNCTKIVEFFLKHQASADVKDNSGDTPFDDAYIAENPNIIQIFIESKTVEFSPSKTNKLDRNLLHMAAKKNEVSLILDFIEDLEVPIDVLDSKGNTPFDDALFNRNFGIAEILLSQTKNFDPNKYNTHYKRYPLHMTATSNKVNLTEYLLSRGAQVDVLDEDDNTPLHIALQCGNAEVALILAKSTKKSNIDQINKQGQTPLLLATELRDPTDIVQHLVDAGAEIDKADNQGNIPFYMYFYERNSLMCSDVSVLALRGIDWNGTTRQYQDTFLHLAMRTNSEELAVALIIQGLSLDAVNCYGETPLIVSITHNNCQLTLRCLFKYGKMLDLNIQDNDGQTLLHWAVMIKAISIIRKLIELGVDPEIKNNKGETPLHLAFIKEYLDGIRTLFKTRPDTNLNLFSSGNSRSALHLAVKLESIWMVKLCLNQGLKINCCDTYAKTPLHKAIAKKNFEIIKILLESDISRDVVNLSDRNGQTFLHRAVEEGDLEVVKCLVEYGALIHIYDGNEKTPIDIAGEKEFNKIRNYLKSKTQEDEDIL